MPSKTQETLDDHRNEITKLHERQTNLQTVFDLADFIGLRDRMTAVEQRVEALTKLLEESERKRWQLWVVVLGGAISVGGMLVVNLFLLVLKK